MKSLILFLTLLTSILTSSAFAGHIVSGISTNEINIDTEFLGAKILLFGAKEDTGNVFIVVRGPKKNIMVTKKEKLLGVWYNGQRVSFKDSPVFYSLFSTNHDSPPIEKLLSDLELGKNHLNLKIAEGSDQKLKDDFQLHLIDLMEKDRLYKPQIGKVDFLNETLFKVMLEFPKNIIRGVYTVEIYLIDEGSVMSFQSIPVYVNQVGISARIFDFAYQESFLYGLIAVLIALIFGWTVNYIFTRFFGK